MTALPRWLGHLTLTLTLYLGLLAPASTHAQATTFGPLIDAATLHRELGAADLLVLDASSTPQYVKGHLPGAVSTDLYRYGIREGDAATMQQRLRSWGVGRAPQRIVVYDQGGEMAGPRLVHDLLQWGVEPSRIALLDGGLARWKAIGGAIVTEAARPAAGDFEIPARRANLRSSLDEVLSASGQPARQALVDALGPEYYYGAARFFDRQGHLPNARLWSSEDFYNPDKTFKSREELQRMATRLGLAPGMPVHTYCGGGVAAAVPWYGLHVLLNWPQVRLFLGSQHEYLRDDRRLPMWTHGRPAMLRERDWVAGWGAPMLRLFDAANLSVIDVRPPEAYARGHLPFALNIPAETFERHLHDPTALAGLLGPAGVSAAHEVTLTSDGVLNERSALAWMALQAAGQRQVSLLAESVEEWGLAGQPLPREATTVGMPKSMSEMAVRPAVWKAEPRTQVLWRHLPPASGPRVFFSVGIQAPDQAATGTGARLIRVPAAQLLDAQGLPRPAGEMWTQLSKAGLPRDAEVVAVGRSAGEAAMAYALLQLMAWPDAKAWIP